MLSAKRFDRDIAFQTVERILERICYEKGLREGRGGAGSSRRSSSRLVASRCSRLAITVALPALALFALGVALLGINPHRVWIAT